MKHNMPIFLIGFAATAILAGCSTKPGASVISDKLFYDESEIIKKFEHERKHLNGKQPSIGLALSGGGTKAAVFAHGVLHGLSEVGILDQIDVISSTSGGGYAAFWYFSKRMDFIENKNDYPSGYKSIFRDCFPRWTVANPSSPENSKILKQVVELEKNKKLEICSNELHFSKIDPSGDPYRWQAHLMRWPDVFKPGMTNPKSSIHPYFNQGVNIFASIVEGPFQLIGLNADSYTAVSYQYGIERTWGLNPRPRKMENNSTQNEHWEYNNSTRSDSRWVRDFLHVAPETMQWKRMSDAYKLSTERIPLWILNTMQGQKDLLPKDENLFEITPFGYGSPRLGYKADAPPLKTMAEGVRASAAFADSQGLGNPTLINVLQNVAEVFPAATWGISIDFPEKGTVRLSDGGGADNLALISAVRRGLEDIVIVDAASDERGNMLDLCWSKKILENNGFKMQFPDLQDLEKVCTKALAGNKKDQMGYNVSEWRNPITKGTLIWPGKSKSTRLWLIKAAWDEKSIEHSYNNGVCGFGKNEINCLLSLFWGANKPRAGDFMSFPQHGTASMTLDSDSALFIAYRELGRMLASHLNIDDMKTISTDLKGVLQPALDARKSGRPVAFETTDKSSSE